ncbi:uncharacterized protein LOC125501285 [Athalia rosae]|uniref:uncharacterized protein LOC125501285 n=1 Tax=Athalia rosae TaxID=37344 RepID=UPI0020340BB3|nr:uncharacterized protein LOC125501285 [Athalia rosae]
MNFFILSAATLFAIFHHWRATADGTSGPRREIFPAEEENVLKKFFTKFQEGVANADLGYVAFVGGSNDQLVLAKSLMKNHPYLIGENMQNIETTMLRHYNEAFVFLFLTRMHEDYVKRVLKDVRNFVRIKLYFIYQKAATSGEIDAVLSSGSEIAGNIYTAMYPRLFLHDHEGRIRLYAKEFSRNCSPELVTLVDLSGAATFENITKLHSSPLDYKGCGGVVLTRYFPPRMILEEESNGGLKITGGSEGNMVLTIAQTTKFSPRIKLLNEFNQRSSIDAAFGGIAFRQPMLMAVDQIRYTGDMDDYVDYSRMYSQECAVWCVPKITKWSYDVVFGEFSGESWILILAIFGSVIAVAGFIQRQIFTATDEMERASNFCAMVVNFFSLSLGNPSSRLPPMGRWRAFLTFFFLYSMVTTTAYKSSLASIIAIGNDRSVIVDDVGILKANLTTGGDISGLILLRDLSRESSTMRELMKRYEICNDTMAAIRRVALDGDFAFLTSRNDLHYHMKNYRKTDNVPLPFHLIDDCVLSYSTGIVMPKGTPLLSTVNNVIRDLSESGHLAHWQKNELLQATEDTARNRDERYETENFYQILVICAISLSASILAFFGELIYHRIESHGKLCKRFPRGRETIFPQSQ